jgi:hypothetical protein
MSAATAPSPSSPVADHLPFANAPETLALYHRAIALYNQADDASALPLNQQIVDLAQAAMAALLSPQTTQPPTFVDVIFGIP